MPVFRAASAASPSDTRNRAPQHGGGGSGGVLYLSRSDDDGGDSRCSRRRSAGGDGGTTLFRSVRSDEDGGNQRTSQRAERAIKHSAMREQLQKGAASIVAVAGPRVEPPDVCRKGPRRAAGTQELHAGKYLGSKHKEQGDPQQNSRAGRPASRVRCPPCSSRVRRAPPRTRPGAQSRRAASHPADPVRACRARRPWPAARRQPERHRWPA